MYHDTESNSVNNQIHEEKKMAANQSTMKRKTIRTR